MSDIDLAVSRSLKLEQLLEREFRASGKGLHQKVSSVERRLPATLVRKLRLVATVRNKVVHESGAIEDRGRFVEAADQAERELTELAARGRGQRRGGRSGWWRWTLVAVLVLGAVIAWLLWRTR